MRFSLMAVVASLGGLLFGYDTGVISGALLFIRRDFALSSTMQDVVTAVVLAGAVGGAAVAGAIADRFGRKRVILACAGLFALGAVGSAFAGSVAALIVARLVVGMAIGVASMLVPLYLAEIAPAELRGATVSLNQFCITFGILVSYVVDYAFADVADGWRWMLGLGAVPGIVLGIGMIFLPESPRWLALRGVRREPAPWHLLWRRGARLPIIVGVGLAVFQQITGINTVIYYAPTIVQNAGFPSASASILATVSVGVVNVAMTVVAMRLLDRAGRRALLLWGLAGMAACLLVLSLAFWIGPHGALAWITVLCLAAYVGAFAIGLGPVFWLLIAEIFPLPVRGRGMSLATVANWGSNLAVAIVFLDLIRLLGGAAVFLLFAVLTLGCFLFTLRYVPETRGQSLEQIEAAMEAGRA